MEVLIEDIGPCKKKLNVKLPVEKVREKMNTAMEELASTVHLPGFRVGKAPRKLLEKRFKDQVAQEVKEELVRDSLAQAIKENNLAIIALPKVEKIDTEEQGGLSFTATVDVRPQINLADYKGIELARKPAVLDDTEVDAFIEGLQKRYGVMEDIPDGVVTEDTVVRADCEIRVDDAAVWSQQGIVFQVAQGAILGLSIEGLKEAISGKKIGDDLEFPVVLPEQFVIEAHRGKSGKLRVRISAARRLAPAELGEALFSQLQVKDASELRERVAAELRHRKQEESQHDLRHQLDEKLLSMVSLELPQDVVDSYAAGLKERHKDMMRSFGASDQELNAQDEKIVEGSKDAARKKVSLEFILDEIADKEKIYATEEELERHIEAMAVREDKRPRALRTEIERENRMDAIRADIREEKTVAFLLEKAKITEAQGGTAE